MFYAALPDLPHTIDDVIADGDRVAASLTARGTHEEAFQNLPPTGKSIIFTGMRFYRMAGGKIAEEWANLDQLGLMQQLGAIPAPGKGE